MAACSHRHPAVITLRTAVDADGKLCALHARALFSAAATPRSKPTPKSPCKDRGAWPLLSNPCDPSRNDLRLHQSSSLHADAHPGKPADDFCHGVADRYHRPRIGHGPGRAAHEESAQRRRRTPFGQKLKGIVVKETLKKALDVSGWKKPKVNIGRGVGLRAALGRRPFRRGDHL